MRAIPDQARFTKFERIRESIRADCWFLTETHEGFEPQNEFASCFSGHPDLRAKANISYQVFDGALEVQKSDWVKIHRDFPKATLIVAGDFKQGLVDCHHYG